MSPTFTTSNSILNRLVKPRSFGMRWWSGVWPPSNQAGMVPPARAFWPFVPRPAVLPWPAEIPRPTRRERLREPGAGCSSCSFMCVYPALLLHFLDHQQVADLEDHTTDRWVVGMHSRLVDAVK